MSLQPQPRPLDARDLAPDVPPAITVRVDDGVPVIVLGAAPEPTYEALRENVRAQLPVHLATINGRASRIDLGERDIALFDLRRLLNVLRDEFAVDVTGLYARPKAIHRFAERELKLKLFPVDHPLDARPAVDEPEVVEAAEELPVDGGAEDPEPTEDAPAAEAVPDVAAPAPDAEVETAERVAIELIPEEDRLGGAPTDEDPTPKVSERPTHFVHKTLRSGASVRFDGDVIVLGDVNPGAEVVSAGNVIVLGALLGVAHAGASGDEAAFVLALDLRPTQVRVARRIAIAPERKRADREPEIARIEGDKIVIEPYAPVARWTSSGPARGPRTFPFLPPASRGDRHG